MKKMHCTIVVSACVLVLSIAMLTIGATPKTATTTLYLDPPTITATAADQNFTINVNVQNVTDLWSWQISLEWDPLLLECLSVEEGPFLKKHGDTWFFEGDINNELGELVKFGCHLTTVDGESGSGTLVIITFNSTKAGTSAPHIWHFDWTVLIDSRFPSPESVISFDVVDIFTVVWDEDLYTVSMVRNSSISNFAFNHSAKEISFNVSGLYDLYFPGAADEKGFCNVTLPKTLLRDNETHPWTVLLNATDKTADTLIVENDTHTSLYFTYPESNVSSTVEIIGSWVVPEFPTAAAVTIVFVVATLVAVVLGRKTRHWSVE